MEQEPIPLEGVVATSKTCYKSSTTGDRYKNDRHLSVAATDKLKTYTKLVRRWTCQKTTTPNSRQNSKVHEVSRQAAPGQSVLENARTPYSPTP